MLWFLSYEKIKKTSTSLNVSIITPFIFFFFIISNTVANSIPSLQFLFPFFCEPPLPDGFCLYHSTSIALVKILYPLCCFIQGQFSGLTLFDLSEAFDTGNRLCEALSLASLTPHCPRSSLGSSFSVAFAGFLFSNASLTLAGPRDHPLELSSPVFWTHTVCMISALRPLLPSVCWQLPDPDLSPGLQASGHGFSPCFALPAVFHIPGKGILPGVWGKIFGVAFDFFLCHTFNLPGNPLNLYSYRLYNGD